MVGPPTVTPKLLNGLWLLILTENILDQEVVVSILLLTGFKSNIGTAFSRQNLQLDHSRLATHFERNTFTTFFFFHLFFKVFFLNFSPSQWTSREITEWTRVNRPRSQLSWQKKSVRAFHTNTRSGSARAQFPTWRAAHTTGFAGGLCVVLARNIRACAKIVQSKAKMCASSGSSFKGKV